MSKKKKIVISVFLACIFALTVAGAIAYHAIAYPFKAVNANIKITQFANYDLMDNINYLNGHRSYSYFEYLNEDFEFDLNDPNEYCYVRVSVDFKNSGSLTMTPKYLIPKVDNDVIGFSVRQEKYSSLLPEEVGEVFSDFVCRRNGMTDKELTEYILGLDFYFLQNDNILGEKQSKISLKKFATEILSKYEKA